MVYFVTVAYREPSYEAHAGARATPYRWTFAIEAPDAAAAREEAVRRFREMESLSQVGWVREIVDVFVSPTSDLGPDGLLR